MQGAFARRQFTPAERLALFLGRRIPGAVARLPLRRDGPRRTTAGRISPAIIDDRWPYYLEQNGLTPIEALAHRTSLVTRLDLRPILPEIGSDLLLIQGNEDRIVPHRFFEELKALLPGAESVIMPHGRPHPHLTHAEMLAQVIGDWLLPCNPEGCQRESPGHSPGDAAGSEEGEPDAASNPADAGGDPDAGRPGSRDARRGGFANLRRWRTGFPGIQCRVMIASMRGPDGGLASGARGRGGD